MPGVPCWKAESGLRDGMGFDFYLALLTEHIIIVCWLLSLCKKDDDNGRMDEPENCTHVLCHFDY